MDRNDRITRQAFREFHVWTERFGQKVRERAAGLAHAGNTARVLTSDMLVEAVRAACEDLAAEIRAGHNTSGQEDKTAA